MDIRREWVTPLAAGAFLLSAVTGVLMFFHKETGMNKLAHEWLGWALLAAAAAHVAANFSGFRRHLGSRLGQALVGAFALVLAASFLVPSASHEPPFAAPVQALAEAPLKTLAEVAHLSPHELDEVLAAQGLFPDEQHQTLGGTGRPRPGRTPAPAAEDPGGKANPADQPGFGAWPAGHADLGRTVATAYQFQYAIRIKLVLFASRLRDAGMPGHLHGATTRVSSAEPVNGMRARTPGLA